MLPMPNGIACSDCGATLESQCPVADRIELRYTDKIPSICKVCGNTAPWALPDQGFHVYSSVTCCGVCGLLVFQYYDKATWNAECGSVFHSVCAPFYAPLGGCAPATKSQAGCLVMVPILGILGWATSNLLR